MPDPYYGPMIDWWQTAIGNVNDTTKAKMGGVISRTATGSTINSGFLQATSDIANFTSEQIKYAGHTFGLYGQGNKTMPQNDTAFTYALAGTNAHGMMVSIFPYDGT